MFSESEYASISHRASAPTNQLESGMGIVHIPRLLGSPTRCALAPCLVSSAARSHPRETPNTRAIFSTRQYFRWWSMNWYFTSGVDPRRWRTQAGLRLRSRRIPRSSRSSAFSRRSSATSLSRSSPLPGNPNSPAPSICRRPR